MYKGDLKHYNKYIKLLTKYAKAICMKIKYVTTDGGGLYVPSRREIKIDPELNETETIATLLHELGHSLDDCLHKPRSMRKHDLAYTALYKHRARKTQVRLVVKCEIRAWEYGKVLAKQLGIRLGKWYDEEAKDAVASYRTSQK